MFTLLSSLNLAPYITVCSLLMLILRCYTLISMMPVISVIKLILIYIHFYSFFVLSLISRKLTLCWYKLSRTETLAGINFRQLLRDRSKFTGYIGRVLGKICLKKSLRPPFSSRKKVFAPLIFSEKKSSAPFF